MNENQIPLGNENNAEDLNNDTAPERTVDKLARTLAEELGKNIEAPGESEQAEEAVEEAQPDSVPEEQAEEAVDASESTAEMPQSEEAFRKLLKETEENTESASFSAADNGDDAIIRFQNVSMSYDNVSMALNNVSLDIKKGEFVFIVGANGAGKTTLTRLLICEERVSSGRLTVNGFRLHKMRKWRVHKLRRTMGMVFQDFKLFDNMTVYENVAFAMRVVGAKASLIRKRVPVFLEMVGIGHKSDAFPTELSGGEKQRVAFARAIVNNPDIVIADEPTGNIDYKMTEGIMELLLKINRLGKTVIVITHDTQIVQSYNKRVIKLENGQIVSDKIGGEF